MDVSESVIKVEKMVDFKNSVKEWTSAKSRNFCELLLDYANDADNGVRIYRYHFDFSWKYAVV